MRSHKSPVNNPVAQSSSNTSNTVEGCSSAGKVREHKETLHSGVSVASAPQFTYPKPDKSYSMPNAGFVGNSGRKMVSTTSVSTNYTIPNVDKGDRPQLIVNNVESTDLKTIKPGSQAAHPIVVPKGNSYSNEVQSIYKMTALPITNKPRISKKRVHMHRPLGHQIRKQKEFSRRPEVFIKFPRVPYASINVCFKGLDAHAPKLKYFNLTKDNEDNFRPSITPVSIS